MWKFNPSQESWFHTWKTVRDSKTVSHSTQDWWFSQIIFYSKNWKISLPPQLLQNTWKSHADDVIHKSFESTPGDIITQSNYAKQLSFETNGQLQNAFFDNNHTLSMEGFSLDCFRKTVNVSNFYENGGGYVPQSYDTVQDFIYIYLIQIFKMTLRLQIISIHYWIGCLIKKW